MDMEISAKDKAKVESAHSVIMDIADKYDMSMEEVIDACCEEGEGEPEEDMAEEEKPAVDKAKIALIIGKMRGHHGGEE
jgi:hypothetical protein